MADRYMQLPMLGVLVAVIWFIADSAARAHLDRNLLTASFALVATPYVLVSHAQIAYWHDSISLFTHALQLTHNNGVAENDLGSALLEKGQIQLAEPHFRAAANTPTVNGLSNALLLSNPNLNPANGKGASITLSGSQTLINGSSAGDAGLVVT